MADLRLLDLDIFGDVRFTGVHNTSRGGVNLSEGGSYGGMGVIDLLRVEICSRACEGDGGI